MFQKEPSLEEINEADKLFKIIVPEVGSAGERATVPSGDIKV